MLIPFGLCHPTPACSLTFSKLVLCVEAEAPPPPLSPLKACAYRDPPWYTPSAPISPKPYLPAARPSALQRCCGVVHRGIRDVSHSARGAGLRTFPQLRAELHCLRVRVTRPGQI